MIMDKIICKKPTAELTTLPATFLEISIIVLNL